VMQCDCNLIVNAATEETKVARTGAMSSESVDGACVIKKIKLITSFHDIKVALSRSSLTEATELWTGLLTVSKRL
jgi:hypothetical protein